MRLNSTERQIHQENLRAWLAVWDKRADGTLMLLSNAARTQGLPLALTRNLASMQSSVRKRTQGSKWNGQLPPDSPVYTLARPSRKVREEMARERLVRQLQKEVYNPVGEAIKLAEGRNNVMLGRIFRLGPV